MRKFILFFILVFLTAPVFAQEDFSDYMVVVREKIQKSWYPPECLEHDGHALVKFSITRRGDIYSTEILESSGDIFYDESAMEALRKASPFPHFPADTARGALTIKYSFDTAVVNTGEMQKYLELADKYYNVNNRMALDYISRAIDEVDGDINSYFLYGKRAKIRAALGDLDGERADKEEAMRLKSKYDKKRILSAKIFVEMEQSAYSYFVLAHAYDIAGEFDKAIEAIDIAISKTDVNNQYKRYREDLLNKIQ